MITKTIEVTQTIEVTVDDSKFDEEFMDEYRQHFYDFRTLDDHLKFLASMEAQGFISHGYPFIEGYGFMKDKGIEIETTGLETEILDA